VGAENPCPLRDLGKFVEQLGVQVNDRRAVASAYAARRVGVEEPTNRLAVAFAELALVVEEPTPSRASACLAIGYRDKSPGRCSWRSGVDDAQKAQAVNDGFPNIEAWLSL
jgi:hypothetical protein